MTKTLHRRLSVATAIAVAVYAALITSPLLPEQTRVTISNLGQCLAPAMAFGGCILASRRAINRTHGIGWKLLGFSALSWCLGQVVWTYYELSHAAAPFPSLADVGYLLAVPLALAAVWHLTVRSSASSWFVAVLDALIIAGGLLAISWPLVLGPSWHAGSGSPFEFGLTLAYPIGDLVIASAVLLALMRTDRDHDAVPLL